LRDDSNGEVPPVVPTPPDAFETQPTTPPLPADLARLVDVWDSLPEAIRTGILALMDATAGSQR
jgi:hypothetical protein